MPNAVCADSKVNAAIVHLGSLAVPQSAAANVRAAQKYLSGDTVERALFDRLEHGDAHYSLKIVCNGNDQYIPSAHRIDWDPYSALRTTQGGRQSPALGLGHEVDHAVHDSPAVRKYGQMPDAQYDSREERRVITGSERHAAQTLGESVRHDHRGTPYRVASPTLR